MTTEELSQPRAGLVEVPAAVRSFLLAVLPDAARVDVTKVVRSESGDGGWVADASVWQPNATIAALGLSTERPVLDENFYVVRLDGRLDVIGYETQETEGAS